MDAIQISVLILATSQVVVFLLLIAFARELGVILVRLGPVQARPVPTAFAVGSEFQPLVVRDGAGNAHSIGGNGKTSTVVLFLSPSCGPCRALLPGLRTFAATNSEHAVIFSICDLVNDDRDQLLSFDLQSMNIIYIPNDGLRDLLGVQGTPFAGLIDPAGRVRSAGVVNSLQHLESLISVEEYVFVGDSAHAHPAPVIGNTAGADDQ